MAKLTDELKNKIIADFHVGKSQNQLAKDYELSPATINKLCKGLTPKYEQKVNIVAHIKNELSKENEYQVFTFDKEVNKKVQYADLIHSTQAKAVQKAGEMIDEVRTPQDLATLMNGIDKASLTLGVNARHAPKTEINNQNSQNELVIVRKTIGGNDE